MIVLLDAASLPDDVGLLKAMLVAADVELEQLRMQVARLRRMAFGRSSERLTREADQLELGLEEAEAEFGGYTKNGGFADYILADPNYVAHIPAGLAARDAASGSG